MYARTVKVAFFSPTGTTKTVVQGIARGINQGDHELIDITSPRARSQRLRVSEDELLVIGVPVYMGRVPALLSEWLRSIQARDTLAVCVVVYGNRAYENALLELKDILTERGCKPVACAAYIGEHSFSSKDAPTAEGRPDRSDLAHAEQLGRKIRAKLASLASAEQVADFEVPGGYPYGGVTELWSVDFIAVGDQCTQCGTCAAVCPVGAVDAEQSDLVDAEKCITCCACIKRCPQGARQMKPGAVKEAAMRVNKLYARRKEPVSFL